MRCGQLKSLVFLGDAVPDFFDQKDSVRDAELLCLFGQLALHSGHYIKAAAVGGATAFTAVARSAGLDARHQNIRCELTGDGIAMAGIATHRSVRVVIEDRIQPVFGGVAGRAIRWEGRGHVIGICSGVEGCQMATGALRGRAGIVAVHVALRAGRIHVGARERELRSRVIESGGLPDGGAVADVAGGGEARGNVIGIGCRLIDVQVAGGAERRRVDELVVHMALRAYHRGMRTG